MTEFSGQQDEFPFFQLPQLLQLRFLELCNRNLLVTLLLEVPHLCKLMDKKIYRKLIISDKKKNYNEPVLRSFKDFDSDMEVYDCLEIYLSKTTVNEADLVGIKVLYKELICDVRKMNMALFEYLLGPSVKKYKIELYIPGYQITDELKEDFIFFLRLLIPVNGIQLTIHCNYRLDLWLKRMIRVHNKAYIAEHGRDQRDYFNLKIVHDISKRSIAFYCGVISLGIILMLVTFVVFSTMFYAPSYFFKQRKPTNS